MASFIPPALLPLGSRHTLPSNSISRLRRPTYHACLQQNSNTASSTFTNAEPLPSHSETNTHIDEPQTGEDQSTDKNHEPRTFSDDENAFIGEPAVHAGPTLEEVGLDSDEENEEESSIATERDNGWFEIVKPIGKPDTYKTKQPSSSGVVNLAQLDGLGREALASASYHTIVDIDIEEGGVLPDDDDNNDLFCGVGLEALVDTPELLENMRTELGIETATHVQLAAIPRVADGKDMVVQSHTGTGKTLAFLLPMLDNIDVELRRTQGIVVAPTRELAMQIYREIEKLVKGLEVDVMSLIGGANPARQVDKLRKQTPHVVVGTPGRLAEMHEHRELRLHAARMMVVDEVDHSIGEAFAEDIAYLLSHCPRKVQKVLVSATSDVDAVRSFATKHLYKPVLLRVGGAQRLPKQIGHWYSVVPARMRIELLRKLMNTDPAPTRAIAFVDEPRRVDMVAERLYQMKIPCGSLRGDAHKLERAEVLTAFRKGRIPLLITTEVAARGLDIPDVTHVFNLDLPTDGDHYVHRAGRCGRVRNAGTVVSFATAETAFVIGRLQKELGVEMVRMEPRGGKYVRVAGKGEKIKGAVAATRSSRSGAVPLTKNERGRGRVQDSDGLEDLLEMPRRKKTGKGKGRNEKEQKEEQVKLRWRDKKNKGKRRVAASEGHAEQNFGSGEKMAGKDGESANEKKAGGATAQSGPSPSSTSEGGTFAWGRERSLKVKARKEGWVGNR